MAAKPPFIRSPYNYDVKEASDASSISTIGESLTVQSQSEDADINVLMKRFGVTGKFPENPLVPTYGDFSQITDFRSAFDACDKAAQAFMQYPADFRARFDNDPQKFLDFADNPGNISEMHKLGLMRAQNVEQYADRGNAPPGGASSPPGGAGSAQRNAGAGVPEQPAQRSASDAGSKAGSA